MYFGTTLLATHLYLFGKDVSDRHVTLIQKSLIVSGQLTRLLSTKLEMRIS